MIYSKYVQKQFCDCSKTSSYTDERMLNVGDKIKHFCLTLGPGILRLSGNGFGVSSYNLGLGAGLYWKIIIL